MIYPAALISVLLLISASMGSEESCYLSEEQEDQCASVCYPIVKPLLRYFEKTNEKDTQLSKCKTDNSELQKKYSSLLERHSELSAENIKYENLIIQKNAEIEQLKYQISVLKKTSELAILTNQFREDIAKLGEIIKIGGMNQNNQTNSNKQTKNVEVETGEVVTTPLPNINNQTTSKTETIDLCSRGQDSRFVREIQIPGSEPFKVVCVSFSEGKHGWLQVYSSIAFSHKFNRTYEEYERGFGDVGPSWSDEFFIGLKRLHLLTNKNHYDVILHSTAGHHKCDKFVVGDRREGYMLKNIDNCFEETIRIIPKPGSKFSTFDRDEDGVPDRNWAKELGFGWWFDPDMGNLVSLKREIIDIYIQRTE